MSKYLYFYCLPLISLEMSSFWNYLKFIIHSLLEDKSSPSELLLFFEERKDFMEFIFSPLNENISDLLWKIFLSDAKYFTTLTYFLFLVFPSWLNQSLLSQQRRVPALIFWRRVSGILETHLCLLFFYLEYFLDSQKHGLSYFLNIHYINHCFRST